MTKQPTKKVFQVEPCCSFCGKTRKEVKHLLASKLNAAFICNECVAKNFQQEKNKL
jgi:ATP-dependent protease Clp ATPase subunit